MYAVLFNALWMIFPAWYSGYQLMICFSFAALAWLVLAVLLAKSFARGGVDFGTLLKDSGLAAIAVPALDFRKRFLWVVVIVLLVLSPGYVGALSVFSLVMVLFCWRFGKVGLNYAAAVSLTVSSLLVAAAIVIPGQFSAVCGLLALAALLLTAIGFSKVANSGNLFLFPEYYSTVSALVLALPLGLLGGMSGLFAILLLLFCLVLPLGFLLVAILVQRQAIGACKRASGNIRGALQTPSVLKLCEDPIRESDGYYRVCQPIYSHYQRTSTGESGYIGWPEHDNAVFPTGFGGWLLFRSIASQNNPIFERVDQLGRGYRRFIETVVRYLVESIGDANIEEFTEQSFRPWSMRYFQGQMEVPYLKMPWEHGEVLAVPKEFLGDFIYPNSAGVLDKNGLPCEIRSVTVQVTIEPQIIQALNTLEEGRPDTGKRNLKTIRDFVRDVPLIVPSIYESILRRLIDEVAKIDSLRSADHTLLSERIVNQTLDGVTAGVVVKVTSITIVQTALSQNDVLLATTLEQYRTELPVRKLEVINQVKHHINTNMRPLQDLISSRISELEAAIVAEIETGRSLLKSALGGQPGNDLTLNQYTTEAYEAVDVACESQKAAYLAACQSLKNELTGRFTRFRG